MNSQVHLSYTAIESIAAYAARNVCEAGSPAAAQHNTHTIANAIRTALAQATVVTVTRSKRTK
jgi:hypothetical protein